MTKPVIGWIGMGRMGYAMVERLIKAGYAVGSGTGPGPRPSRSPRSAPRCATARRSGRRRRPVHHGVDRQGPRPRSFSATTASPAAARTRCPASSSTARRSSVDGSEKSARLAELGVERHHRAGLRQRQVREGRQASAGRLRAEARLRRGQAAGRHLRGARRRLRRRGRDSPASARSPTTSCSASSSRTSPRSRSWPRRPGVPRHAFLEFMNNSVMGSIFTRYKSNALVNLDWTTTFTPALLRKDLDLGLGRRGSSTSPCR